jgi:AcrR family transcriptional regulator
MPRVSADHEAEIRDRIVVAALHVFGAKGYHRTTIADIVRESGLSVGAIYTYFPGKDAIYLATCDMTAGQGLGELAARIAEGRTTAERFAIAISFFLDAADAPPDEPDMASFLVQAWAQAEAAPAVREMLVRRREQFVVTGQMLLREGLARGELPAWIDVDALAWGMLSLLDGLLLQKVEAGPAWRRPQAEDRALEVLTLLVAAAAVPDRPVVPRIAPRAYTTVDKLAALRAPGADAGADNETDDGAATTKRRRSTP